ncbi:hypothetical protein [uncultured Sulfitobacter sp.]|uniref:hypothetical protein n=1 Tax=uncultured Sulfitobacter sp. TaxID=191468 RepID=UPI002603ECDF|nr:hypothetical protein [uncultured Sulfitobacter sp.]
MDPAQQSFHDRLARLEKNAPPREVMFDFTKSDKPIRATPAPKAPRDQPDIHMPLAIACGLGLTVGVTIGLFADSIFAGTQTVKSAAMAALDENGIYLNYDPETLSAPSASVVLDKSGRPLDPGRQRSVFENAPAPPTGFIATLQKTAIRPLRRKYRS